MKGGFLHTRSFRRIHFSVLRYRWSKNGFTGPKTFRGFRETGPSPVRRDPGIAVSGSRLTGLRFFHVIVVALPVRLISASSHQNQAHPVSRGSYRISYQPAWLKVISVHRRSLANRASPAHVIRLSKSLLCRRLMQLSLSIWSDPEVHFISVLCKCWY